MEQLEETLFARKRWMENKMTAYGFQKVKDGYTLEKPLMGGDFKAVLTVNAKGKITGKVIDPMTLDEYYQLRQEAADGAYVHILSGVPMPPCCETLPTAAAGMSFLLLPRPTGSPNGS